MDVKKDFGDRIRELRLKKGLTQDELASRSGLDRTYIPGIERGDRNVSIIVASKLAKALGVRVSKLF